MPLGRRGQATHNAQQAGFAATVITFDVKPAASCNGKAHALEQGPLGLLAGQVDRFQYPRRHRGVFRSVEDMAKCNDRLTLCVMNVSNSGD
jgi:hypothetical protein